MKHFRLYLIFLLTIHFNHLHAQLQLYIGQVEGISKSDFAKIENKTSLAEKFLLPSLSESSNEIEIRFYQSSSWDHDFCTILTYNTTFSLKRIRNDSITLHPPYDSLIEINPIKNINADSVFKILIKNEIFNLPPELTKFSDAKNLSNHKVEDYKLTCTMSDGSFYVIDCKIGNVFKRIYTSSGVRASIECFPYNSGLQRRLAIINLMEAKYKLISKKKSAD